MTTPQCCDQPDAMWDDEEGVRIYPELCKCICHAPED